MNVKHLRVIVTMIDWDVVREDCGDGSFLVAFLRKVGRWPCVRLPSSRPPSCRYLMLACPVLSFRAQEVAPDPPRTPSRALSTAAFS
jgi:hypothetical protein